MRDVFFNNVKLNNYMIIKDIKESILPLISNNLIKLNNNIGAKFIKQEMGERVIEINVEIISDTLENKQELIDRLSTILFTQEEQELVLDNRRKYKAVFEGESELENLNFDGVAQLTFVAADPISTGNEIVLDIKNGQRYFNSGNYKSRGVIDFRASSNVATVRLKESNEYDYIKISNLKIGDIVKIDLGNEFVTVNDDLYMKYTDPLGDFFDIPSGEFELEIIGANDLILIFFERWL